jgi:hypothetical protein
MRRIPYILLSTFLLLNISCRKDDIPKEIVEAFFTLDSKIENQKGFLFENLQVIDYPNASGIKPDFSVIAQMNDTGLVIGPFLYHPDLTNNFILTEEFVSLDSAKSFYASYKQSNDTIFEQFALNIKPYQIWTIKTANNKRGKILILQTTGEEINNSPFAEIAFFAGKLN